ncbi:hypothetical protein L3N51_01451 [Metallosphaera sp. J1]|uniref:TM1812 family CRISPR-associated protein n=1 Tax=Metallosphaera javensis (ex Hofmann et al. 2022) TaxID=99938 RepID=UPI001EDF0D75|nr:TM1812 family CRISPR-associated protein [Metallosphaera javensis (ex Hofmann et al. 2022)]MCG3109161.1 hypothetical protein [Metallosphaera javensis (ex Hofmann et al. 2022)]
MTQTGGCLAFIAGDVTGYEVITYNFLPTSQKKVTFFSAHALDSFLNPTRVIALLPDSLLEISGVKEPSPEMLSRAYRNLLTLRARELSGPEQPLLKEVEKFLEKMEVILVPNTGYGSRIVVRENGEREKARSVYNSRIKPNFIFNVFFSNLKLLVEQGCSPLYLDVTHGTNVLTSIMLSVGAMLDARIFASPLMGRPGKDAEVNVIELTSVVEAMKSSILVQKSISLVDERYLSDFSGDLRSLNVTRAEREEERKVLSRVKGADLGFARNFLADLRMGLTVSALVEDMKEVEERLREIEEDERSLSSFYREWYRHVSLNEFDPLILSRFSSILRLRDLVKELETEEGGHLGSAERLVHLYARVKYYDKALSLARELPVALCMKVNGGGKFDVPEPEGSREGGERMRNTYTCCREMLNDLMSRGPESVVVRYRNYLMHAELSEDEKVEVNADGALIRSGNKIGFSNLEKIFKDNTFRNAFESLMRKAEGLRNCTSGEGPSSEEGVKYVVITDEETREFTGGEELHRYLEQLRSRNKRYRVEARGILKM